MLRIARRPAQQAHRMYAHAVFPSQTAAATATSSSGHHRLLSTSSSDSASHLFFTTRDQISGREVVEEIGMVSAAAVRSKSVLSDMYVALAGLFGGEAASYTSLMNETMEEAAHRMQFAAQSQGATAVVNVRFDSNTTMNRLVFGLHCSVICYGTAVRCRPLPTSDSTAATISAATAAAAKLAPTSPSH